MPKVIIAEKDLTNAEAIQNDDYIVLIPGTRALKSNETEEYFKDADTFKKSLTEVESGEDFWDLPSKMAYRLLKLGMTVLYRVISDKSVLDDLGLESGDLGFWGPYKDKSLYNLRFLTAGGYASRASAEAMIRCAAARGDAIALIDFPEIGESGSDYSTEALQSYIKSLAVDEVVRENGVHENSFKYAAAFAPTIKFKESLEDGGSIEYPASFGYLACFAKHVKSYPDWFAMAGSVRGKLPYEGVETSYRYGQVDIDSLQDRTTEGSKAVNVITEIRPYGNIVWGNRTLFPIETDPETDTRGLKASSFLNIRHICCDIKKTLYRAARRFTFEPNSDTLWINFKGAITPLLEEMRTNQGIRGYKVVKETTDQKATLKAVVKIIPIEAVEDFDLTVELSDSIAVTE
jgi:hypothetical protein